MNAPAGSSATGPLAKLSAEDLSRLGARLPGVLESEAAEHLAVLATFDPETSVLLTDRLEIQVASDELSDRDGRQEWMLKERVRVGVLARVLRRGGRAELVQVRTEAPAPPDSALQRMLDTAIQGRPVDTDALDEDELVAALHVGRWCAAAGSLGAVPDLVPAGFDRERVAGRLALIETIRPIREITADGCVGREAERDRLRRHVETSGPPLSLIDYPALLVYGIGGVGKSTLVAQFVLDLAERTDGTAWAYLDLDRPSLSSYDPLALVTDVIRQVGAQFPQTRRYLDRTGLESAESASGFGLDVEYVESWRAAIPALADAVNGACRGRLVVIVDTYEELQREEERRGEKRVGEQLFRLFAELSDHITQFRLVVCGRAPALTFVSTRHTDQRLHVEGFRGDAATAVLQHLYLRELTRLPGHAGQGSQLPRLDPALAGKVVETVGGSPLALKLAARVLALEGAPAVDDAAAQARALGQVAAEFVMGFLYHRILGHLEGAQQVDTRTLQAVARAALAVRLVTPDVLREVIFPVIGRGDLDADAMIVALGAETALADREPGILRVREELRGPALLALRYAEPDLVADVHRKAAAYYAGRPGLPRASAELAYHRLALGEAITPGDLDPSAVAEVERSITDLPPESRELVARTVADPASLAQDLLRRAAEREVETEARRALEAGQVDEADRLLTASGTWAPTTTLHQLVAQIEDARGNPAGAAAAAGRDVAAAALAREPERFCAAAIRQALLLERWAGGAEGAAVLTDADGEPWLAGHHLLRLELQLNRLAMLERSGLDHDRWLLDLGARAMLQRADPSAVRSRTALVRLLAATIGHEEPGLVLDAIRSVGLGTTTYSTHLRNLAAALAKWDTDRSDPGTVSRSVGLSTPTPSTQADMTEIWFQAVASTSADAGPLLDRAFSLQPPPSAVVEAVRTIYLWWGVNPQQVATYRIMAEPPPSEPPSAHALDSPLDAGDITVQNLLRALSGAYPTAADIQVLAARAGIDVASLDVKQSRGHLTRSLLDEASSTGRLGPLVQAVLADPATESFHGEIRDLVGPEWLDQHGIAP